MTSFNHERYRLKLSKTNSMKLNELFQLSKLVSKRSRRKGLKLRCCWQNSQREIVTKDLETKRRTTFEKIRGERKGRKEKRLFGTNETKEIYSVTLTTEVRAFESCNFIL